MILDDCVLTSRTNSFMNWTVVATEIKKLHGFCDQTSLIYTTNWRNVLKRTVDARNSNRTKSNNLGNVIYKSVKTKIVNNAVTLHNELCMNKHDINAPSLNLYPYLINIYVHDFINVSDKFN